MSLAETDKILRMRVIHHQDADDWRGVGRWVGYRAGMMGTLFDLGISMEEIAETLETSVDDVRWVLRERARMAARKRLRSLGGGPGVDRGRVMQCRAGGRPATYSTTVKAVSHARLHPFTPRHQLINTLVTYPQGMQDEWASYPGHDLNSPPPGAAPGACLGCQGTGRTWREYMAVGPCRAIDLDPGEVGSVPVLGLCKYCRGYGWTWHTKLY